MSVETEIRKVPASPAMLGECPVWSVAEQALYWVDIDGCTVNRYEPATGDINTRSISGRPGSIALTSELGRLLVAVEHELCFLDWSTGRLTPWVAVEASGTGNRLNDGRCDPAGRFVVGSMFSDISKSERTGELHQVSLSGQTRTLRTKIGISNGLAFDSERQRMYFADSPTQTVLVFDYDPETGRCANAREFFDYRKTPGWPDGACVDADGCYWSASVFGWSVVRITPDGRLDHRIKLPLEKPTMPCFGGPNLSTLYITSISGSPVTSSDLADDSFAAGDVLILETDIQGIPDSTFKASHSLLLNNL